MPEPAALAERSWNDLLDFLDPKRQQKEGSRRDDVAEARYLEITRKLVCFFAGRGCRDPEDLAMTTVLRVAAKCGAVDGAEFSDPTGYFYGVARNVLHEAQRDRSRDLKKAEILRMEVARLPIPDPVSWHRKEAVQRCLDQCMAKLSPRASRLLRRYYSGEGEERIEEHQKLADEACKSVNALRIEVHRIKNVLRRCVFTCLGPAPGADGPGMRQALDSVQR